MHEPPLRFTDPPRAPREAPLPGGLHPRLAAALPGLGIERLYSHQAAAWRALAAGRDVALTSGTASGKSLAYALPIADRLLRDPGATALLLFPTKALAADQLAALRELLGRADGELGGRVAAFDGDTPSGQRPAVRERARVLVTNPDMLHLGILPHHPKWRRFLGGLAFVVIDEAHSYRGVFGGHLVNLLRRLARVAARYGAAPRSVLTSATLANAREHAERLVQGPVALIEEDGAPFPGRELEIRVAPLVDAALGVRAPVAQVALELAERAADAGVRTLVFVRSRRMAEELLARFRARRPELAGRARAYRSGYRASERRATERALAAGELDLVFTTNALELGIDVGAVERVICVGWPGSVASLRQQIGRAGRRGAPGSAQLVLGGDPLEQYLAQHPERIVGAPVERALAAPDHPGVLLAHLRCAAFELPFAAGERFGRAEPALVDALAGHLEANGELVAQAADAGGTRWWSGLGYPAEHVDLRGSGGDPVLLNVAGSDDDPEGAVTLGSVDRPSAPWMVHPGAVYLHAGEPYLVTDLDLEAGVARLAPSDLEHLTDPVTRSEVALESEAERVSAPGARLGRGEITLTREVTGYAVLELHTRAVLARRPLELPPTTLWTEAYWIAPEAALVERLAADGLWSNDANDYGPAWPELRRRVRRRDGYRCTLCGAPEAGRQHDVHHRVPFRTFADRRAANRPENLVTLCRACHRRAERVVRVRSGMAGAAHALRGLAPLLLMCERSDLGVLHEPQSVLAEGGPAFVLYDTAAGGIGLSATLFGLHGELMAAALERVDACPCAAGCPSCVGPPGELGSSGKAQARALLAGLAGAGDAASTNDVELRRGA